MNPFRRFHRYLERILQISAAYFSTRYIYDIIHERSFVPEIKNVFDTHIQEIKAQVLEGKCDLQ